MDFLQIINFRLVMHFQFTVTGFIVNQEDIHTYFATSINPYQFYAENNHQPTFPSFPANQFHLYEAPVNQMFKTNSNQYRQTDVLEEQNQSQNNINLNILNNRLTQNISSIGESYQNDIQNKNQPKSHGHLVKSPKKQKIKKQQSNTFKSQKNLKKNTESNIINNIFSFITCKLKSQREVQKLLQSPEQVNIFYIFANNLKKLNGRYVNRKNVQAICQIQDKKQHAKMLAKSVKRLLILPIPLLRKVLRRIVFSYLRGSYSLLPLLTSKKICKQAIKQHLDKKRQLIQFLQQKLHRSSQ